MYMSLNINSFTEKQLGQHDSINPRASNLFDNIVRDASENVLRRFFRKAITPILVLEDVHGQSSYDNRRYAGSQTVAVKDIHGTVDRGGDFDYDFTPLRRSNELRWTKVATAMLNGVELPPVELIQVGEHYFVKDGHHRISVARALGFAYIDAVVEVWS